MTRTTTIYAAILAEHGNTDEPYPHPLTCDVCGFRKDREPDPDGNYANGIWWEIEDDAERLGWHVIISEDYKHKMIYCPSCFADRAEPREEEELDY